MAGGVPTSLTHKKAAAAIRGFRARTAPEKIRLELAKELITDFARFDEQLAANSRKITRLLDEHGTHLRNIDGVGPVLAARILGRSGRASRFPTAAAYATISLSLAVTLGSFVIGVLFGLIPRASRGLVEVTNAAPPVVTGILIAAIFGPSAAGAAVAVLIVTWAPLAAHTAALVEETRARPYIAVLPTLGAGETRILFGSIVPSVLPAILRHAMLRLPGVALALAALGFLGLGPQPPAPDWGLILSDGVAGVERAPWVVLAPLASLIALAVLAVSLSSATSGLTRRPSHRVPVPVPSSAASS